MIRQAISADVPDLVGLGRMFHASTRLAALAAYEKASVAELLYGMINTKDRKSVVLVMEKDRVVVGGIAG